MLAKEIKKIESSNGIKFNKYQTDFMLLADEFCCVPVTEWVSGKGTNTKQRALPKHVYRISKKELLDKAASEEAWVMTYAEFYARRYFALNPRRSFVLVLDIEEMMNNA